MDGMWKLIAGVLTTAVLALVLEKRTPHMSLLLSLSVLTMITVTAVHFLEPVLTFLKELGAMTRTAGDTLQVLFKALGLSLISKLAALLCADAGYSALGRGIEAAGVCAVLRLSVPVFSGLMELVRQTVGGI